MDTPTKATRHMACQVYLRESSAYPPTAATTFWKNGPTAA
jgi:hypothetical protein